jgi:phosphatidylglycerophosphatase A
MEVTGLLGKRRTRAGKKSISAASFSQLIATGFGIGYLPLAPGTWASLATAFFVYLLHNIPFSFPRTIHAILVVLVFPIAWITSTIAAKAIGKSDPSVVVIDEVFGQMFCLLWVPITPVSVLAGFGLFRVFDIVKPPPVKQSERLRGGLGIVMDDLVAGICASVILGLLYAS